MVEFGFVTEFSAFTQRFEIRLSFAKVVCMISSFTSFGIGTTLLIPAKRSNVLARILTYRSQHGMIVRLYRNWGLNVRRSGNRSSAMSANPVSSIELCPGNTSAVARGGNGRVSGTCRNA